MSIQDRTVVRTAADLERKYNLSKLTRNVEMNGDSLLKVENELNNMITSLIINLGDVLDSQSDISLWFYSGTPTKSNAPYTTWTTPDDHIGDLYYDQSTGYVYKYDGAWVKQTDINLVSAMALTNAELDVSEDHERKVYFSQPIPPYSNGDWWLLEDGTLQICQLSKNSGTYEKDDFVVSSKYTTTVATKQDDTITVLKGTVLQITEDYVKYTDLGTGGSTQIAGDRITTGSIKSKNYVSKTSGMKIDLDNGILDSKNLQLDANGDLNVGGYITSTNGILTNLRFTTNCEFIGQNQTNWEGLALGLTNLSVDVFIPENFEIVSANVTLVVKKTYNTFSTSYYDGQEVSNYGKVKNIKLYKQNDNAVVGNSPYTIYVPEKATLTEVKVNGVNAFGTNGYTNSSTNGDRKTSADIKEIFMSNGKTVSGTTTLVITSSDTLDVNTTAGITAATQQTQYAYATVDIIGYLKIT